MDKFKKLVASVMFLSMAVCLSACGKADAVVHACEGEVTVKTSRQTTEAAAYAHQAADRQNTIYQLFHADDRRIWYYTTDTTEQAQVLNVYVTQKGKAVTYTLPQGTYLYELDGMSDDEVISWCGTEGTSQESAVTVTMKADTSGKNLVSETVHLPDQDLTFPFGGTGGYPVYDSLIGNTYYGGYSFMDSALLSRDMHSIQFDRIGAAGIAIA